MDKLVSKLGINRASLYNTFGNKREFFSQALTFYMETRLPDLLIPLHGNDDFEDRLRQFFNGLISLGGETNRFRGCFVIGSMAELSALEPRLAKLCTDTLNVLEKDLRALVKRGQKAGEIRTEINADDLTTMLISSAIGLMTKARTKESPRRLKAAVELTLYFAFNGK